MTRAISTIIHTVSISLTVLDDARFQAAFREWKNQKAAAKNPTRKQFFQALAHAAQAGNEAPAKAAGCSVYYLKTAKRITTKFVKT